MNLGGTELAVISVIGLVTLGLVIWALIDVFSHSPAAFAAAESSRTTWIVLLLVTWLVCGLGWVFALIYLIGVRPRVSAAERSLPA